MAFHFNWSPLIADTDRVRHMLTSSLNRSPKPPIIVDDIIVNELNLGQTPPSLEILEIGDLAEDRFRGIFKVKYEGDAYLQLRTKVQANPLNTFLSTKPSFASPGPLAAGSGLTIPLQITLSEIRLSGFVILVFNKQKGITLVFRNDPLESLKVSSTFDSIPFVRNYLQKTIEEQLRVLFIEDLPVIIHKLSLRVFNSEYERTEITAVTNQEVLRSELEKLPGEASGSTTADATTFVSPFPADGTGDTYASFSQKNLLRLAALTESQRTLSLFTPSIRDTVVRAWATAHEHDERRKGNETPTHRPTTLSRIQSQLNISHGGWSSNASQSSDVVSQATRPSVSGQTTTSTTYSLASGRSRPRGPRKKKHRVVNLRRNGESSHDGASDALSVSSGYAESTSRSESISASGSTGLSSPVATSTQPTSAFSRSETSGGRDGEVETPASSPQQAMNTAKRRHSHEAVPLESEILGSAQSTLRPRYSTPRQPRAALMFTEDDDPTPRASVYLVPPEDAPRRGSEAEYQRSDLSKTNAPTDRASYSNLQRTFSETNFRDSAPQSRPYAGSSGGILEQAWMTKMAHEVAKRVEQEKRQQPREHSPLSQEDGSSSL